MTRWFNIAGRCFAAEHDMIPVPRRAGQHTAETAQRFEANAVARVFALSAGHRWLVNVLADPCPRRDVTDRANARYRRRVKHAFVTAVALLACTHSPPPEPAPVSLPPATPVVRPGAPTAVLEPGAWRDPSPPTHTAPPPATPSVTPPPAAGPVRVRVVRTHDAEGEDGHGDTVAARWPVAIELERDDGWTAGALTTTLLVGPLHFHNVGYPSLTVARYIVADGRSLPTNAEVALQYGGTPRRVIAPSLPVPR